MHYVYTIRRAQQKYLNVGIYMALSVVHVDNNVNATKCNSNL